MYPSFPQFARWAASCRAVPLWIEPELPASDLLEWVHALAGEQQDFFFLHSASPGSQARYSYIALEGPRYHLQVQEGALTIRYYSEGRARGEMLKIGNPAERFRDWFAALRGPRVDGLPPFWGGAVGYFGYESAAYFEPRLSRLFSSRRRKGRVSSTENFSPFEFGVYDAVAIVDHARGRLWLVHTVFPPAGKALSPLQLEKIYRTAQDRLRRYAVKLQKAVRHPQSWGTFRASKIHSNLSEAAFRLMVRRAKGFIGAGDLYQCNLSQSFSASWGGDPWTLYQRLAAVNPSPYAALWRSGRRWMVSASPELLLRQECDRVETRPIAGTYPRGEGDDAAVSRELQQDSKERAEHIMLVDLERSDLGRVCRPSSVRVSEFLALEAYSHVLHLVSDVRGQLAPAKTWYDSLRACFPGGTITGCPKLRSLEVIDRLEAQRRGPYTGSLGWIGFTGDMTLNILIRTFFLEQGRLTFPAGAGIVADSDPLREYQETLHKAQALIHALQEPRSLKSDPRRLP